MGSARSRVARYSFVVRTTSAVTSATDLRPAGALRWAAGVDTDSRSIPRATTVIQQAYRRTADLMRSRGRLMNDCSMKMVGVRGFEPPAPCSQSRCATGLRHTPPARGNVSAQEYIIRSAAPGPRARLARDGSRPLSLDP